MKNLKVLTSLHSQGAQIQILIEEQKSNLYSDHLDYDIIQCYYAFFAQ